MTAHTPTSPTDTAHSHTDGPCLPWSSLWWHGASQRHSQVQVVPQRTHDTGRAWTNKLTHARGSGPAHSRSAPSTPAVRPCQLPSRRLRSLIYKTSLPKSSITHNCRGWRLGHTVGIVFMLVTLSKRDTGLKPASMSSQHVGGDSRAQVQGHPQLTVHLRPLRVM